MFYFVQIGEYKAKEAAAHKARVSWSGYIFRWATGKHNTCSKEHDRAVLKE